MPDDYLVQAWNQMATDSFSATGELFEAERWRSALSRAYYAAYARVVAGLLRSKVSLPSRGNPGHRSIPGLILDNMTLLNRGERASLSSVMDTLYKLRIAADYHPGVVVDESDARVSGSLMVKVFSDLKEPRA